jgi:hypothetical protein
MEEIMVRNRSTIVDLKATSLKHTDSIKELELNLQTAKDHRMALLTSISELKE